MQEVMLKTWPFGLKAETSKISKEKISWKWQWEKKFYIPEVRSMNLSLSSPSWTSDDVKNASSEWIYTKITIRSRFKQFMLKFSQSENALNL